LAQAALYRRTRRRRDVVAPGVGDVELLLVEGEREAVRSHEVVRDAAAPSPVGVDAVDVAAVDLGRCAVALVVAVDAVARVGELR